MPDKGKVEGLVKYARANFMTPIPQAASFDDLNAMLVERCRQRQGEVAGRHSETIGERLVADLAAFRDLPAVALEPARSGRHGFRRRLWSVTAATTTRCQRRSASGMCW